MVPDIERRLRNLDETERRVRSSARYWWIFALALAVRAILVLAVGRWIEGGIWMLATVGVTWLVQSGRYLACKERRIARARAQLEGRRSDS